MLQIKNENTWYQTLGHFDAESDSIPRVFKGWWLGRRLVHYRNSDGNLYVRYLYWNDGRWNWSNNWLDNEWNVNNPAAVSENLFISLPLWESFVLQADRSSHRAFYRLHLGELIGQYTFCYPRILFPREPLKVIGPYPSF